MKNNEYIGGICSSLEKNLISEEKIEKLLSLSFNDALKQVKDFGFGKGISSDFVEDLINKEESELISFVKLNSPSENYTKLFLIDYDYHNAESLLRSIYLGVDEKILLTKVGYYDIEKIREYIVNGKSSLSSFLEKAIKDSKKQLEGSNASGAIINKIFIQAKFDEMLSLAEKENIEAIKEIIDLTNFSLTIRSFDEEYIDEFFIKGGNVNINNLKRLIKEGLGSFIDNKYKGLVGDCLECREKGLPLVKLENYLDSFKLKKLMANKYLLEGYDKFYLYVLYKQAEIRNVRILLVGLKAGIEKTEIKARLRCNYAG